MGCAIGPALTSQGSLVRQSRPPSFFGQSLALASLKQAWWALGQLWGNTLISFAPVVSGNASRRQHK